MSQFIEMFGNGTWKPKCLGEVGTFKRGGGFQKSDYVERGIPCIHYGQIHTKFGPFIYSHISEISSDLESKTKFASKGDLIIAITSEDAEGSCKSTAWLGNYPVAVGGHAAIFHHCMNPLYMSFFFRSTFFNHAKMEYIHGTKVFEIKPDDIAKILVPCPPMSLQEQFSAIAEQADKSEFDGFKSQFIEMFGDLSSNSKGWPVDTLGSLAEIRIGPFGSLIHQYDYKEGGHFLINPSQIINDKIVPDSKVAVSDEKYMELQSYTITKGDIVLGRRGEMGRAGIVESEGMLCGTGSLVIRPKDKNDSIFLHLFVTSQQSRKWLESNSVGTTMMNLNTQIVSRMSIPILPTELKQQFVSIAEHADKSESDILSRIAS